jgi:hypothetical protein
VADRADRSAEKHRVRSYDFGHMSRPRVTLARRGIVVRRRLPAAFAKAPDAPRRMSLALVDALAALHAVDYAALGLPAPADHRVVMALALLGAVLPSGVVVDHAEAVSKSWPEYFAWLARCAEVRSA